MQQRLRFLSTIARPLVAKKSSSFHKRPLPVTLTALASPTGKQLFREAMSSGGMESYFPLAEQFVTQSDPSYCSLSSLSMVLNALNFDPKKVWKGAWRWVSEETLQCETKQKICGHSLENIKNGGLSFAQFESLARCHGVKISSQRVFKEEIGTAEGNTGIEKFRCLVDSISGDDKAETFLVVNFSRGVLGQTGDGHYSPIGGYHKEKGLVLVMDVARFKYPPYWVPLDVLWAAMAEPDSKTEEPRGYFVISGWHQKQQQNAGLSAAVSPLQQHMDSEHNDQHTHDHQHSHNHDQFQDSHDHSHNNNHSCSDEHCSIEHSHDLHVENHSMKSVNINKIMCNNNNNNNCQHSHERGHVHSSSCCSQSDAHTHSHTHAHNEHTAVGVLPSTTITLGESNSNDQSTINVTTAVPAPPPAGAVIAVAMCPTKIRAWEDFKKYEPKQPKRTSATAEVIRK